MARTELLVLLVAWVGLAAGCSPNRERGRTIVVESVQLEGIPNARLVGGELLFGGQPTREALILLASQGYRTVVNTRGEGELDWNEQLLADSLGMDYVSIPMPNPVVGIQDAWVDRLDTLLHEGRRPMLLHCSSGNRVAGLWAVWLAENDGVAPDSALAMGAEAGMTRIRAVVEARLARN